MSGNINLNQTSFAGVISALVIDADKDFGGFNITNLGAGGHNLNTKLGYLNQDLKIAASPTFVGLTLSGLTQGSVLFGGAGGIVLEDNHNLFWDNVNNWLGIGRNDPTCPLDIDAPATAAWENQLRVTDGATGGYFAVTEWASGSRYLPAFLFRSAGINGFGGGFIGVIPSTGDTAAIRSAAVVVAGYEDTAGSYSALENAHIFMVRNYNIDLFRIEADGKLVHQKAATFNEEGGDYDFRVEGVGEPNALFVQGSDGSVGIGTASPGAKLDVAGHIWQTAVGRSVFLGEGAGANDDLSSNYNVFIGYNAGITNDTGNQNIAIGAYALNFNTEGRYNVAIGHESLYVNTTGEYNTAVGWLSLHANSEGDLNTAIGDCALCSNTTGRGNVAIGNETDYYNQTGSYNTIVGYEAGEGTGLHSKSGNVFIGHRAGRNETGSNKLYIENSDSATPLIGGDFSADEIYLNGNVGIGTTSPQGKLHVGDQATNYLKVASDGEVGLVGTARVERHWLIDPTRFKLPSANYPAESFEGLFYTLDFDKSTDESAYCEEHVPYRWDSSTDIEVEVWWLHDSVDAGVAVWGIEYLSIKEDETVGAAGTTITQASAGNHTAGELQKTTFTTKILHANLETHDAIAIRLFRDADNGSDTLAEDARVVNVCFHFIMNKLGQAT